MKELVGHFTWVDLGDEIRDLNPEPDAIETLGHHGKG